MRPPVPKYFMIKGVLRARLEREYAPGARLPSEAEFCKDFGVSRMTIQQALSLLTKDGLIRREQGRGTFYVGPSTPRTETKPSELLESVMRREGFARVVREGVIVAPPRVAERLGEGLRPLRAVDPNRQPHHVVVRLDDPVLFHCPMVFMENVESLRGFSEEEATNLRNYLVKGGFLWVDDFWGSNAWANWEDHISSVLPPSEFPIFDLPISHPIMHTVFDVKEFLQVPNINFWYRSGGSVSERGYDSAEVHYRGIQNSRGHLMVLTTHNTDVSDTWEREGAAEEYFNRFSPRGYAIGVNVVVYALTH